MEAMTLVHEARVAVPWQELFSNDPAIRRKWLKQIVYRMPGRPGLIFLYLFIVRGGILDGRAGFIFCSLRFMYEYMINAKIQETKYHD